MSNRRKLRVPPRYERPAELRPDLGDAEGEAAFRASWNQQRSTTARAAQLGALRAAGKTGRNRPDRRRYGLPSGPQTVATVESAPTLEACTLRETTAGGGIRIAEAKRDAIGAMVVPINVIRSGWNSSRSRYYGAGMLERDVPRVYPKGTHMFMDHPSQTEEADRPERSLLTLAAVFNETPWPVKLDDGRTMMCTEARVFGPWQQFIEEAGPYIGVSINGHGSGDHGEAEGSHGFIVESLTYGQSVDFVTVPGAGGGIVTMLESAHANGAPPFTGKAFRQALDAIVAGRATREAASLGAYLESRIHLGFTQLADDLYGSGYVTRAERIVASGAVGDALAAFVARLEADAPQLYQRGRYEEPAEADTTEAARTRRTREATAEERRRAIDMALQDAYGGDHRYVWSRDYDPDRRLVWFDAGSHDGASPHATWQQAYTVTGDNGVALDGARIEVVQRTVYEPVPKATETTDSAPATGGGVAVSEAAKTPDGGPPARQKTGTPPDTTKEAVMAEIPDTELRALRESASAGETARGQVTTLTQERDNALAELAGYRAGASARPIIDAALAESDLPAVAANRIRAQFATAGALPLLESTRGLNEDALRVQVGAAIKAEGAYLAAIAESAGAGRVSGVGGTAGTSFAPAFASTNSKVGGTATAGSLVPTHEAALAEAFAAAGMPGDAAKFSAKGRN